MVVHQHTRVLMADLHRCGDDRSECRGREGRAWGRGAVVDSRAHGCIQGGSSGPNGASASRWSWNFRAARRGRQQSTGEWLRRGVAKTVCIRAMCTEALTRIRKQSRLAERSALVERLVEAVEGSQAAVDEHRRPTVGILPPTRQQQESEQKNENRRKG